MTTKPKTRKAPAARAVAIPDPIFALIDDHKAAEKEMCRLQDKFDEAQFESAETHGKRPASLIWWRSCDVFDEDRLDHRREEFLSQPGVAREQIKTDARLAAAERTRLEWDTRAGTSRCASNVIAPMTLRNKPACKWP